MTASTYHEQALKRGNARFITSGNTGKIWLLATRPIAAGEEVFVPSGYLYWHKDAHLDLDLRRDVTLALQFRATSSSPLLA